MAKMVVGLFDDHSDAQGAHDDLLAAGFNRSDLDMVGSRAEGKLKLDTLTNAVPEPDVRFYQEGIRQGGTVLIATVSDTNAQQAADIMTRHNMVDIDSRMNDYNTRAVGGRSDYQLRDYDETQGDVVLPVIEENIQVGKRQVERGRMRVYTHVEEIPVEEQVRLREEHVHVERRPVDRPVTDADLAAMQDRTIEVTEMAEEAVVQKQARIVEEVVINKEATEHTETIRDTVRRTDVDIDQTGAQRSVGATSTQGFTSYDNDFRSYFQTNYANSGYSYDQYSPVFRYGYDLAGDTRYQGDWNTVEPEARRYWEERNPGTWDQFKDSIRYAWDKARGRR
jgi:uncharacterized protein (TIGR02271 family)